MTLVESLTSAPTRACSSAEIRVLLSVALLCESKVCIAFASCVAVSIGTEVIVVGHTCGGRSHGSLDGFNNLKGLSTATIGAGVVVFALLCNRCRHWRNGASRLRAGSKPRLRGFKH